MRLCSLVDRYQWFGETCHRYCNLKERERGRYTLDGGSMSPETPVPIARTTWSRTPEDNNINIFRHENLKCNFPFMFFTFMDHEKPPYYINNCLTRCNTKQSIYYSASSLYVFRVSTTPSNVANLATSDGDSCTKNMTSTGGCSYSLVYSWWWVWLTPETCRANLQNYK